ncbi:MAG: flagellar basal body rod protein FlgB [Roseburia faecis]
MANVNTPGYKRKDLNFENTLKTELGRCKHESLDSKMKDVDLSRLNPSVYVDSSNYSYRLDGSNVDIDTEEVELASEQIRYQGITAGINGQFDRMRSVIK